MLNDAQDKVNKLNKILDEARRIKQAYEEENGTSSTRISNKDILFWLVTKHFEQDVKIETLSSKVKLLQAVFFGTIISTIVLVLSVVLG